MHYCMLEGAMVNFFSKASIVALIIFFSISSFSQVFETSEVINLNYENGLTTSGVKDVWAGVDVSPSAVFTSDAIISTCTPSDVQGSFCAIRTKVICNENYYTGEAHRSESHSMNKPETLYSAQEFYRYDFSFKIDRTWIFDNTNSIDSIFQFKRFQTGPDGFFAIKGDALVYRHMSGDLARQIIMIAKIPKEEWFDVRAEVFWSAGGDGETKIFLKKKTESDYRWLETIVGPNMSAATPKSAYLKWGIYKPGCLSTTTRPDPQNTATMVYHDNVRVARLAEFQYQNTSIELSVGVSTSLLPKLRGATNVNCSSNPQLPAGLSFDSRCAIVGIPTYADISRNYKISLRSNQGEVSTNLQLKVNGPPTLIYPQMVNIGINKNIDAAALNIKSYGEIQSCRTTTQLPLGVLLDSNCVLTGKPMQTLNMDFEIEAKNSLGSSKIRFNWRIVDIPNFYYENNNVLNFTLNAAEPTRYLISKTSRFYPESCTFETQSGQPITLAEFSLNPASCTLSGWPSRSFAPFTIYVRGRNAAGSTQIKVVLQQK